MKGKNLYIIIAAIVLIIIIGAIVIFSNNKGTEGTTRTPTPTVTATADANEMVDCGAMEDPSCFFSRMTECLPVTAKLMSADGSTTIEMTILGQENETCHFQRKVNDVKDLDCYFPKGTMNWDTIDQTFGNDHGLQSVVDSACKSAGW